MLYKSCGRFLHDQMICVNRFVEPEIETRKRGEQWMWTLDVGWWNVEILLYILSFFDFKSHHSERSVRMNPVEFSTESTVYAKL